MYLMVGMRNRDCELSADERKNKCYCNHICGVGLCDASAVVTALRFLPIDVFFSSSQNNNNILSIQHAFQRQSDIETIHYTYTEGRKRRQISCIMRLSSKSLDLCLPRSECMILYLVFVPEKLPVDASVLQLTRKRHPW